MPASVLLVEDNEQNLELASFLLEEADYEVRSVRSAAEAREALAGARPDLMLLDMQLPDADGLAFVAELRGDPRFVSLRVVALTAHAMRGDRERYLQGGCDGYIAKPIVVREFVSEVRRFLTANAEGGA